MLVATLLQAQFLPAQTVSAPDYKIKAGFIYNFAKLTEWPTNAFRSDSAPIQIGVVGADLLAKYLEEEVKGRSINGRTLTVVRYKPSLLVTNCHVLFIDAAATDHAEQIPAAVRNSPILTIGESEKFLLGGGIIRLVRKNSALRFEIERKAARTARLKFSSKLLALALSNTEENKP